MARVIVCVLPGRPERGEENLTQGPMAGMQNALAEAAKRVSFLHHQPAPRFNFAPNTLPDKGFKTMEDFKN